MFDLHITEQGTGKVIQPGDLWRLTLPPAGVHQYSNAQITNYRARHDFSCRAPVALSMRARFQGKPVGTAGFGFWSHPFSPDQKGIYLPRAVWFFYGSLANTMALALDVPVNGWKCAVMDALNWHFFALAPLALPGMLLMRNPILYRRLWPLGQRALKVDEAFIAEYPPQDWMHYQIQWTAENVTFLIDDTIYLKTPLSPRGALGFIAWIDNQYAIVTPQGRFGGGLCASTDTTSLEIADLVLNL